MWPPGCTCDLKNGQRCKCFQSDASVMAFVQNALILMPQLVSPLAYETSGKGADTEPEYLINMFKRDLEAVNRRDGTQMELFKDRVHLMRWLAVSAEMNPNTDPMGHEQDTNETGTLCGKSWK